MDLLSLIVGFLGGVAAVIAYNMYHGAKVDKLSQELKEEIAKLKAK